MSREPTISCSDFKKYCLILNEAIDGLTRLEEDLADTLFCQKQCTEAKCRIAAVSLKCIDRKFRNILFDGEPPCLHCTTEYLEDKKEERDRARKRLECLRQEYYLQEEHMSKLANTLQEGEVKLAMHSVKSTHEGLLISRLVWRATKPRRVLEMLTSECTEELHDLLNLIEACIYSFATTYGDTVPNPNSDEYQYVLCLCGILTNLSSIPDGRLFLMWNPIGRAIYSLILDIMGNVSCREAGSLKWMMLIVIYNIVVNPFGRKLILKHKLLHQNLAGCISPENCGDIVGAALHIIKIFVDDFIDDNDMVSVLMYQLPLKEVYSLSKSSEDINIRKIANAIVTTIERKVADCYNCPACRKAAPAEQSVAVKKQSSHKKKKPKKRIITKAVMTSNPSICGKCAIGDDYITSESVLNVVEESTSCAKLKSESSISVRPPKKKPSKKKCTVDIASKATGELCETPSLKAKGKKKIVLKTILHPSSTRTNLTRSSCIMKSHSTGNLGCVPALKSRSKSADDIKAKSNKKLFVVNQEMVLALLSKLDLDTYLRPNYSEVGIPFKSNDNKKCVCSDQPIRREVKRKVSAVPKKSGTTQDACVCAEEPTKEKEKLQFEVVKKSETAIELRIYSEQPEKPEDKKGIECPPVKQSQFENETACVCANETQEQSSNEQVSDKVLDLANSSKSFEINLIKSKVLIRKGGSSKKRRQSIEKNSTPSKVTLTGRQPSSISESTKDDKAEDTLCICSKKEEKASETNPLTKTAVEEEEIKATKVSLSSSVKSKADIKTSTSCLISVSRKGSKTDDLPCMCSKKEAQPPTQTADKEISPKEEVAVTDTQKSKDVTVSTTSLLSVSRKDVESGDTPCICSKKEDAKASKVSLTGRRTSKEGDAKASNVSLTDRRKSKEDAKASRVSFSERRTSKQNAEASKACLTPESRRSSKTEDPPCICKEEDAKASKVSLMGRRTSKEEDAKASKVSLTGRRTSKEEDAKASNVSLTDRRKSTEDTKASKTLVTGRRRSKENGKASRVSFSETPDTKEDASKVSITATSKTSLVSESKKGSKVGVTLTTTSLISVSKKSSKTDDTQPKETEKICFCYDGETGECNKPSSEGSKGKGTPCSDDCEPCAIFLVKRDIGKVEKPPDETPKSETKLVTTEEGDAGEGSKEEEPKDSGTDQDTTTETIKKPCSCSKGHKGEACKEQKDENVATEPTA